jgi:hypothetical protein
VSEACFLSEFAKFVRNGARKSQRDRAVSGRLPSKAIADHVNSAVGDGRRPNRQDAGKLASSAGFLPSADWALADRARRRVFISRGRDSTAPCWPPISLRRSWVDVSRQAAARGSIEAVSGGLAGTAGGDVGPELTDCGFLVAEGWSPSEQLLFNLLLNRQ